MGKGQTWAAFRVNGMYPRGDEEGIMHQVILFHLFGFSAVAGTHEV